MQQQSFQSRTTMLKNFEFPASTETKFVTRAKTSGIGFKNNSYDETLEDFLPRGVYNKCIKDINKICDKVYIKKRMEETGNHDKSLKLFMNIAIGIVFVAFFVAMLSAFDKTVNQDYFYLTVVLVSAASLIMFSVILYSLFKVTHFTDVEKETKKRVCGYLARATDRQKAQYGIRWSASKNLFWIEIIKDARIKGLRLIEFTSLFLSKFLEKGGAKVEVQFKRIFSDIKDSRRILRMFYGIYSLRRILKYNEKDTKGYLKRIYLLSKVCAFGYFTIDTSKVFIKHFSVDKERKLVSLKKLGFGFLITGLVFSSIYYLSYLIISYFKEDELKMMILDELKPCEVLQILKNLSKERRVLLINLFANLLDIVIGLKYIKLFRYIFNTRINDLVFGIIGIVCSALRLVIVYHKKKITEEDDGLDNEGGDIEIFEDYD